MKKLTTLILAFTFAFGASALNLPEAKVAEPVKASLKTNFTAVTNVTWNKEGDFYFAEFNYNNRFINAAFDEKGELVAVSRVLRTTEMPLAISIMLNKRYNEYNIAPTVEEVNMQGETFYVVKAQNEKRKLTLKCCTNGNLETLKRERVVR